MYNIEKNVTRLYNNQPTFFLDRKSCNLVKSKLKKNEYNIFLPYPDSEKVILYKDKLPEVILYEIISSVPLRHQDILGTIFSHQISDECFGDIVIIDGHYYVYILKLFQNYFESNFVSVKNSYIELKELDIDYLSDYERSYEKLEFIVSSERIDTVISHILNTSRGVVSEKCKDKEIIYNDDILKKLETKLKVGDTFSIRRVGKFKYMGILKNTKSGNFIVSIYKYL